MKTLFLLFSHQLTEAQKLDAKKSLNVTNFLALPPDLQQVFSNVPPDLERLDDHLTPILEWIDENATDDQDYILIQGDFGVTHYLVDYCKSCNYATPIYATTARKSIEKQNSDGSITTQRIFEHVLFREF